MTSLLQEYNGLDCIATFKLWTELKSQLEEKPWAQRAYDLKKSLQAPALYAMMRGILIDAEVADQLYNQFIAEQKKLESILDGITKPLKMGVINLASPQQKIWLMETLGAKVPLKRRGDKKATKSTDRESLEAIAKAEPELSPICNIINAWQDRAKMTQVLKPSLLNRDGRMHTGYKIAGTKTNRWSSGQDVFSFKREKRVSGMNMQNIKRDEDEEAVGHASIRSAFIADRDRIFLDVDVGRADSFAVALEVFKWTGDKKYLEACFAYDLHTYVARLVYPDRPWNGDWDHDIKLAKQFVYRQYDYRFMCKKIQHGGNYLGSAWELARQMKITMKRAQDGLDAYFTEFPAIHKWHTIRSKHLQTTGYVENLFHERRNVHSRLDTHDTLKKIIAHLGQSVTAGVINRAINKVWACQIQMPWFGMEFLGQVHDSILEQLPDPLDMDAFETVIGAMTIPITVTSPQGETITAAMPLEPAIGWNWASWSPSNPDGLIKLKPGQMNDRTRSRQPAEKKLGQLDRRLSRIY